MDYSITLYAKWVNKRQSNDYAYWLRLKKKQNTLYVPSGIRLPEKPDSVDDDLYQVGDTKCQKN